MAADSFTGRGTCENVSSILPCALMPKGIQPQVKRRPSGVSAAEW